MTRQLEPPLERLRQETEANQQVFLRVRASYGRHEGLYAVMRSGVIIDFFPNRQVAMLAGNEKFGDRIYSIHRVRVNGANRPTAFHVLQDAV